MRTFVLAVLALLKCAHPFSGGPDGAWQSNRELTVSELRQVRGLSPQQLQLLSSPDFFGHMVYVFSHGAAITVYEGECSAPMHYQVDGSQIRFTDGEAAARAIRLTLDGDRLRVPIASLPGRPSETFTPVDLAGVSRQNACVKVFVGA
jgi:hypothetical protein